MGRMSQSRIERVQPGAFGLEAASGARPFRASSRGSEGGMGWMSQSKDRPGALGG